jgi:multidrug efflux pump subunit AcrB
MLEQSMQAKFLIPMALAISFGLMSATFLILLLLPALLVIGEDFRLLGSFLWNGNDESET